MNKIYYNRLKALYAAGRATAATLDAAVERGWITAEQRAEILGEASA